MRGSFSVSSDTLRKLGSPRFRGVISLEWQVIFGWFLAPVCAALAGVVISQAKQIRKSDDALREGMRVLLRQQLIALHEEWVLGKGYCPVYIKQLATSIYNAYHALRGNGTGTKVYEEIMNCPSEKRIRKGDNHGID